MGQIKVTKKTGFCFGVRRAVTMAEDALDKYKSICSLGSIIHNRQVVDNLSRMGLKVVKDIRKMKKGTAIVISSHGLSPRILKDISKRGIKVIDTTCPFVVKAQKITRHLTQDGYKVVIVGDVDHPEVKALVDIAPKKVIVVRDKLEAGAIRFNKNDRVGIISQTTQSTSDFLDVVKAMSENGPKEIRIINTICNDAEERQRLAKALAKRVDLMLIIGGKMSANTRRLFEVCKKILRNSHLVETEKDLKPNWLKKSSLVGLTSGASTPDWVIRRVIERINLKLKKQNAKLKFKTKNLGPKDRAILNFAL